jgi:hypothetical protein
LVNLSTVVLSEELRGAVCVVCAAPSEDPMICQCCSAMYCHECLYEVCRGACSRCRKRFFVSIPQSVEPSPQKVSTRFQEAPHASRPILDDRTDGDWSDNARRVRLNALLSQLEQHPSDSPLWFRVADALRPGEGVRFCDTRLSRRDCVVNALRMGWDNGPAWRLMGELLSLGEQISINGVRVAKRDCYVRALQCNEFDTVAWFGLSTLLEGYEELMMEGLSLTPLIPQFVTAIDCCVRCLKGDPRHEGAYLRLAECLFRTGIESVAIGGTVLTAVGACRAALRLRPKSASAWRVLALVLGDNGAFVFEGVSLSRGDCEAVSQQCELEERRADAARRALVGRK